MKKIKSSEIEIPKHLKNQINEYYNLPNEYYNRKDWPKPFADKWCKHFEEKFISGLKDKMSEITEQSQEDDEWTDSDADYYIEEYLDEFEEDLRFAYSSGHEEKTNYSEEYYSDFFFHECKLPGGRH